MNAEEYYKYNATIHGHASATSRMGGKVLPPRPTEVEWALHWFRHAGIRGSLLDVGCGPLNLLRGAEMDFEERTGTDIVSYPIWAEQLQIKTLVHNLDEGKLPFPDASFDAVTMLMVLEHVFDPYHAVRELRRVVKPQGAVVIGVPNIASIRHRIGLLFGKFPVTSTATSFPEGSWDGYHLHNFTRASLDWLLRREGLMPEHWAAQGAFQSLKRISPSLFGYDLVVFCRVGYPEPNRPAAF